jgi:hypothetical protein
MISTIGFFCSLYQRQIHAHCTAPHCNKSDTLGLSSIALAPSFAGLRRFPEGRGFKQWTGNDSKALGQSIVKLSSLLSMANQYSSPPSVFVLQAPFLAGSLAGTGGRPDSETLSCNQASRIRPTTSSMSAWMMLSLQYSLPRTPMSTH